MQEKLIQEYFHKNCTHEEILCPLRKNHGIRICLSKLRRTLLSLGLKRKYYKESNIEDIVFAMIEELSSSGYILGYRSLWKTVTKKYNLTVKRDTVYYILRIADPEGVADRLARRLQRRQYLSPGPNFLWHLDGYDKLKPFGFAIHGCIDDFSRMIIWLEVGTSNNDPKITAHYYLKSIKQEKLLPTIVRSDHGSENVSIESPQIELRQSHRDQFAREKSFIKGRSVRNQRIESYWGQMRKHTADFYIQFFKCMEERNIFDGSRLHIKCYQYSFGPLIKYDLLRTKEL